ncbi:hypothetical protein ANO11243_019210 [Dothideomycetidae sp. 11243]|nr:hypothetical protein ANO11243_019210 [fungal sp. No.11243]
MTVDESIVKPLQSLSLFVFTFHLLQLEACSALIQSVQSIQSIGPAPPSEPQTLLSLSFQHSLILTSIPTKMPSSSTGTTQQEQQIKHHHATIRAHLFYYQTQSVRSIPYTYNPSIKTYESLLPSKLCTFFAALLDAPTSLIDEKDPSGSTYHRMQQELQRVKPDPSAVLDNITGWMEALALRLDAAGRVGDAFAAAQLANEVWDWRREVRAAEKEVERDQVLVREGVRGVCLRWGV